jgi:tetratricopeptide (TPR) repeat protein
VAAPLAKPDEPAPEPGSDADGWALLEALRRRLDDQAAHGRKTQAQVTQLAESIAALVAEQRRRSLWLNVNSFVAYLVFTILCGAGCYLLYRSRAHELTAVRDQAVAERDAAVRRADEALARAVARESADTKAWEVYQLLEVGQRGEAVAKLAQLREQPLSRTERAVLAARVHDSQVMEVDAALKAAAAAFKAGRPGDVIKPLEAALLGEPPGARAAMMHYYLGVAYARTELDKAAGHLQAAIASDVEQDDVRFQLASVLDRSGAYAQARAEYDRFATAHPQSPLAMFAMRRSATLARMPAAAADTATPSGPPAPGAAAAIPPGAAPPAADAAGPTAAGARPANAVGAAASPPAASVAMPPASPNAQPPGPPPGAGNALNPPRSVTQGAVSPAPGAVHPAGAAPVPAPRPVRPWLRAPIKPQVPAKPAAPAAPPSDSPADRAAEPPPSNNPN